MATVLVTGSNRGIGLEFVRQYTADGWDVIAACRNPAQAAELQKLAGAHKNIRIETLDVANDTSIAALAKKLGDTALDVLINNAGVPSLGRASNPQVDNYTDPQTEFGGLNAAQYLEALKINAVAPVIVTQALVPHVARSKMKKVVMISSRLGSIEQSVMAGLVAYSASKAALNMGMKKIAAALAPQGVTVASFHPGWVKTDMGGPRAEVTPQDSVSGMRKVIESLTPAKNGGFFNYDGKSISW